MNSKQFKIERIRINKFHAYEYKGIIKEIKGKSLFVYGTNNTGKSTSLDAIIYSIFGLDFIDRNLTIADTEVVLKNNEIELIINRKYKSIPRMIIRQKTGETPEIVDGDNDVYKNLIKYLNIPESTSHAKKLIYALTIPQSDNESLLRKYPKKDLDLIISSYSSGLAPINRIREIENDIEIKNKEIEKIKLKKLEIEQEIKEYENEIRRNEHHLSDEKHFIQQYESGELFKTIEILKVNKDISTQLSALTAKRTGYYDKKYKLYSEITKNKQFYKKELIDAIKETLSVLVCPVCEDELDTSKIEKRKERGTCPFCGSNHNPENIYKTIEDQINFSNEKLIDLEKEAKNVAKNIKEIEKLIVELNNKISISKTNFILTRIKNLSREVVTEKYEEVKENKIKYENSLIEIQKKNSENKIYIENLDDEILKNSEYITKLEEESTDLKINKTKEGIKKFNEELNKIYSQLITPHEYRLEFDGKLYLYKNSIKKDCSDKNALGYSERKLIDFALWITFIKLNNNLNLKFALSDDIFENIDNQEIKWKDNLLSILNNIKNESQIVLFSIDKNLNKKINLEIECPLRYDKSLSDFNLED